LATHAAFNVDQATMQILKLPASILVCLHPTSDVPTVGLVVAVAVEVAHPTDDSSRDIPKSESAAIGFGSHRNNLDHGQVQPW
jgi:hypothetical protein